MKAFLVIASLVACSGAAIADIRLRSCKATTDQAFVLQLGESRRLQNETIRFPLTYRHIVFDGKTDKETVETHIIHSAKDRDLGMYKVGRWFLNAAERKKYNQILSFKPLEDGFKVIVQVDDSDVWREYYFRKTGSCRQLIAVESGPFGG